MNRAGRPRGKFAIEREAKRELESFKQKLGDQQ